MRAMFRIDADKTIHLTRGDTAQFTLSLKNGVSFAKGDIVRVKIFKKKACESVFLCKEFPVLEDALTVDVDLASVETKLGEIIEKPKDFWYEIELDHGGVVSTVIGYDEGGAKVLKLYPEGGDVQ